MSVSTTIIRWFLWFGSKLLIFIYIPLFIIRLFQRLKKCPPARDPILLEPAIVLVDKICRKEVSCEYVIKTYISRIKEVNPLLNAVVEDRFDNALEEAKYVDKMISNSNLSSEQLKKKYPLLGVPLSVKESIAVAGLSNNAGRQGVHRPKAEEDADIVKLAREAGAIPLLVSNTPELCLNWETFNKVTGTTNNPFDLRCTPGGSSGGEASLLSSASSVIGLGSDIAGSLRLPAHFCGIWGHKPSPEVVSIKGHYPDCEDQDTWKKVFIMGPMSRYAVDLPLLLDVIAQPQMKSALRLNEPVRLRNIKIYYVENFGSILCHNTSSEIVNQMRNVMKHMELTYKIKAEKINIKRLNFIPDLAYPILLNVKGVDGWFPNGDGFFGETFRYLTCRSQASISALSYGCLQNINKMIPKKRVEKCREKLNEIKKSLQDILGEDGVLFCPTFYREATRHLDTIRNIFDYAPLALFSAIGFPVTNCPIGLTSKGLPIGMQVVANQNCDRLTLAVAQEIEKNFGGWTQPHLKNVPVVA